MLFFHISNSNEETTVFNDVFGFCLVKVNIDQLKKRAERFGVNVSSTAQKVTKCM